MAKYQLQTVNENGEVIIDSELNLEPNDTLVLQIDKEMTFERAKAIHDLVNEGLEKKVNLITVPAGVNLKVLKITE
ncbi:hypothetical protein EDM57_04345 [Brevibacillus gelatini]|uniref:Uncharacterized protein n=1 Tax=Brevibacillus gelatini TaxID=1655277 RepID=A0A3M8B7M3_9BACL|nr:hypothetical protein [Brevibacillus gelatini]RNB59379.1 hypothetical protein EDM57_04345 [Brevibacillus gelatini]